MNKNLKLNIVGISLLVGIALTIIFLGVFNNRGDHKHEYTETVIKATCEENGYTRFVCSCGKDKKDNFINALGHSFTEYVYDGNATFDNDGTKTAVCNNGCGETDTVIDKGSKLISNSLKFSTLTSREDTASGRFANSVTQFNFGEEIILSGNSQFLICKDANGKEPLESVVNLIEGENVFYLLEKINEQVINTFTVRLYRNRTFSVNFTGVKQIIVEEGLLISPPEEKPEKQGYTFSAWDYDFTQKVISNLIIEPIWLPNQDTEYTVCYYLENLDGGYTLTEEEKLTGQTAEQVTVTVKEFAHFNCDMDKSTISGMIEANGGLILNVYYEREIYTVTFDGAGGTLVSGEVIQEIKYQADATLPIFTKKYYEIIGFDNEFTCVSQDITVSAVWRAIKYKINYDLDGGRNSSDNPEEYSVEGLPLNLSPAVKDNCGWIGWYIKIDEQYKNINDITIEFSPNLLLYAMFDYGTAGIEYSYANGEYSVVGYVGIEKDIIVPSSYLRGQVTKISAKAFEGKAVEKVTIENSVKEIGPYAFMDCANLNEINLPNNVEKIGEGAFAGTKIAQIVIPESVTEMGFGVFANSTVSAIYCKVNTRPNGWHNQWSYGATKNIIFGHK